MSAAVHFCPTMKYALEEASLPVTYFGHLREYGIEYRDSGPSIQAIYYCPWCGARLPESLRDVWFERLEALGLEPGDPNIPAEMLTSQWWENEQESS